MSFDTMWSTDDRCILFSLFCISTHVALIHHCSAAIHELPAIIKRCVDETIMPPHSKSINRECIHQQRNLHCQSSNIFFNRHIFISIGSSLNFPEMAVSEIRILIIAPSAPMRSRLDALVEAASGGDMVHVVVLHCDDAQHGAGFCARKSTGPAYSVVDLVAEIRSSNVVVTFNHEDARHMVWAGVEVAVVVLDGHDALPTSSSSSSNELRLLQLHRYAHQNSFAFFVQSASPSFSDWQIIESAVRAARNFGRGVAFCGVKCGSPMKPQLWTPISYEWNNRKWINEVHDPYEKSLGWG